VGSFLTWRHWPTGAPRWRITLSVASLGAVAVFLIGMVEVSWSRPILGVSRPEWFAGNREGDVDLHKGVTIPLHSVYQLAAWAALMPARFLVTFGPRTRLSKLFQGLVPTPWTIALAASVACFNYSTWPFMPTQATIFTNLIIRMLFGLPAPPEGQSRDALLMVDVQPI